MHTHTRPTSGVMAESCLPFLTLSTPVCFTIRFCHLPQEDNSKESLFYVFRHACAESVSDAWNVAESLPGSSTSALCPATTAECLLHTGRAMSPLTPSSSTLHGFALQGAPGPAWGHHPSLISVAQKHGFPLHTLIPSTEFPLVLLVLAKCHQGPLITASRGITLPSLSIWSYLHVGNFSQDLQGSGCSTHLCILFSGF